ncbi:hypothetical protein [Nocardia arthritidis]|uniref:hypothetical protein n=1 Tax=Nocardia arthritidis TaxID=228602 RepID=UPI0012ED55BB|nr:hypothetical protein [Nocardia arthritidis]
MALHPDVAQARVSGLPPDRLDIPAVLVGPPNTVVPALNRTANPAGAGAATDAMVAAGHVTREAVARMWPFLTSRPRGLRQIDPRVIVDRLP